MTTFLFLLIIVALLICSGLFSGSETALTAASRARMHQLAQEGNKRAQLVNRLREDKEKLIGTILLGNNLVNILASALATSFMLEVVGEAAIPVVTLGMTLLVLIFAEVLPKTYAIRYADQAALMIAPLIQLIVWVVGPVSQAIASLVSFFLRLFRADIDQITVGDYSDELRGAIELHRGPEKETEDERAMLRSILDLANVEVSEIMIHRRNVETLDASKAASVVVPQILSSRYTRIPVWRDNTDNIIGVLHAKDLLRNVHDAGGRSEEIDILAIARQAWFIPDSTSLLDQLQAFRQRREHFALVVDEYGSWQGIVTLEDILEEIVGDIHDEYDRPVTGARIQPDGSLIVAGNVTIRDLNRQFEWRLPDDKASTIAGLVLYESRQIPQIGQIFTFYGFRFHILRRKGNQITLLQIHPPAGLEDNVYEKSK